jgi:hypothetical protein
MPSLATGDLHKTSSCRRSPVRGTVTGVSAVQLPGSRTAAHQLHRHTGRHATTTDAPMRARTSTLTPDALPLFRRASQNLTAAAMLLRGCPEAATSEER